MKRIIRREENGMDYISNIYDSLSMKLSAEYDRMMFELLESYGINRGNWSDNIDRVTYVSVGWYKHFYVDNVYAFSLITRNTTRLITENGFYAKVGVECHVEVIEEMKGEKAEI